MDINKTLGMLKEKIANCRESMQKRKLKKNESSKSGKTNKENKEKKFSGVSSKIKSINPADKIKSIKSKKSAKPKKAINTDNSMANNSIKSKFESVFSKLGGLIKSKRANKESKPNKIQIRSKFEKVKNLIKFNKKSGNSEDSGKKIPLTKAEKKALRAEKKATKKEKREQRKKLSFKERVAACIKAFTTRSINTRILGLVIISSICIIALITIPASIIIVNSIHTSVNSELATMTDTYSSYIELANDRLKESLETVGRMSQITDESQTESQRQAYLKNLCNEMTFDTITIAGITGKTIDGDSVFDEEYFSNARMGQTYLTSPVYNSSSGKNENIVAAQITNGNSAGVVIATVDTDYFNNMIGGYRESTLYDGYCFIVDKSGKIISHYDNELISAYANDEVEESFYFRKLIEKMISADSQELTQSRLNDGKLYYIGYVPIEGDEEWCVAAAIPASKVNMKIFSNLALVVVLALVLLAIVILISRIVARSISNPIISLTGRVVTLAEGDLMSEVPPVESKDETLQLYNAMKSTVKNLSLYVSEIDTVLTALANKDLCVSTKADYHGDFEGIKSALEMITSELNRIMSLIKMSANQVSHGANEMSESAMNLATGATEQTKALDSVMIEIADVAKLAKNNVEVAAATHTCVNEMADSVTESAEVMKKMVSAMNCLDKSSNEIQEIVSVIENIMFQTNILALNASIEASKAGVHGRGFSVVAGEIRNLSENCSGVLKKIANLIKESMEYTRNGVELADNVSEKLEVLVKNASRTTKSVVEIADASQQQAESVEKVKNGLDKIDSVVQSNSAMAEETAAVAEELKAQANDLMNTVASFKINNQLVREMIKAEKEAREAKEHAELFGESQKVLEEEAEVQNEVDEEVISSETSFDEEETAPQNTEPVSAGTFVDESDDKY